MPIAPEAVAIAAEPPTRTAEVVASNKASAIGAPVPDTSLAPVAEQAAPAHVQLEGVTLTPVAATFAPSIPAVPVDEPVPPEVLAANQAPIAQANAGDGAEMQQVASKQGDGGGMPFAGLGMTTNKGPVDIKSDSLSYDSQQHIATFSGHVHAVQADGSLSADNLRVVYGGEDFHEVKTMYADGNVRLGQGTRWATGDHGVLDNTKRTVVMTGSPVVHDGNDEITGRRITTFLDSGRSVVEGARAVIYPKSKNENPEASSSPASASN
jgi:lipopolysaccharide export system protein LptA